MLKNIWKFLASVSLAFWLLLLISATFILGSYYSRTNYHFFDLLNNNRIQTWFMQYGINHPEKSWWLILLFILMTFLAVNTFACTIERVRVLIQKKHEMSGRRFFTLLTPSLIHITFIFVLIGHIITYTTIEFARYPIEKDAVITLPDNEKVKIVDIKPINYKETSYLKNRLINAEVKVEFLSNEKTSQHTIEFLEPLFINNSFFHIDVAKQKEVLVEPKPGTTVCNRAEVKKSEKEMPQFFLLYTKDNGLFIILFFICITAGLMFWYYMNQPKQNNES